jgi:hypothetical protein
MSNDEAEKIRFVVEYLKSRGCFNQLETDILNTLLELEKIPFDMNSALLRIRENGMSYPEATAWVDTLPWPVHKPTDQQTDVDRRYVLENQLLFMVEEELKRIS